MIKRIISHTALFTVAIIYGANYVIAKGMMPDKIGPSGFIMLRVLGALVLFGLLKSFIKEKVERKDYLRLLICGFTGVAFNQLLFFNGLNLTSPVNASIIITTIPISTLVVSAIILKTKITWMKVVGIVLGAVGAISLIVMGSNSAGSNSSVLGDFFVMLNAISYSFYLVLVKPLMQKYKPITVITYVFLAGALVVLPVGYQQFSVVEWSSFDSKDLFSVFYVIVGTTFLAYLLNIFALKSVKPSTVGVYVYFQPLIAWLAIILASSIGFADYSGDFSPRRIYSALLIFAGVFLVSYISKSERNLAQ